MLLAGAVVQRLDLGRIAGRDALVVRARVPGETLHVLILASRASREAAIALLDAPGDVRAAMRAEGRHPREVMWRARLEGARVVRVSATRIVLEKGAEVLVVEGSDAGALTLGLAAAEVAAANAPEDDVESTEALLARGAELTRDLAGSALEMRRAAVVRALAKAIARVERRVDAIRGDLSRIGAAADKATIAQLFVAEAARAPRGAREMSVVDWSSGEAKTVTMPLDPARGAREQLDTLFKRARRLKDGARIGQARLAQATAVLAKLREVASSAAPATTHAELDAIASSARTAAGKDFALDQGTASGAVSKRTKQAPLPPYRTFLASSGAKILVGRGAAQNDALTLHVARPHDLWLHAKGRTGAHVIVPLSKGASCPPEVLVDAAHLAAHFSEERDETTVEVQYTPRRYLRKPRGSAPGLVVVDREKVMILRREDATLRRLLESESLGE